MPDRVFLQNSLCSLYHSDVGWTSLYFDVCNRAPDKRGIEDNSKIIFLIFQRKHVVTPH